MNILLIFPGFIVAVIIILCYEYKIRTEPKNKVRFYVMIYDDDKPCLCIKDIDGNYFPIADADHLNKFGINTFEFLEMPIEEIREVFLNLKN